jgi:hypothetical protein
VTYGEISPRRRGDEEKSWTLLKVSSCAYRNLSGCACELWHPVGAAKTSQEAKEEGIPCHSDQAATIGVEAVHVREAPGRNRNQVHGGAAEAHRADQSQHAGEHLQTADPKGKAAARGRQLHGRGARGSRDAHPVAVLWLTITRFSSGQKSVAHVRPACVAQAAERTWE